MNSRRVLFTLSFAIMFVFVLHVDVFAMNTGFTVESVPETEWESFVMGTDMSITTTVNTIPVVCFAVSDNGYIAIGTGRDTHKAVYVFDFDANFQYGYEFECYGMYGLEWDDNNLIIHYNRSGFWLQ